MTGSLVKLLVCEVAVPCTDCGCVASDLTLLLNPVMGACILEWEWKVIPTLDLLDMLLTEVHKGTQLTVCISFAKKGENMPYLLNHLVVYPLILFFFGPPINMWIVIVGR